MFKEVKDKAVSGFAWSAIDNLASQGITFVIGIILARLLSPKEFGTLGIALIFVGLFNQFVDCGFSNALIRKKNVSYKDYCTAFIFNVVVSLIFCLLCFLLAPFISSFFYENTELNKVLRWLSIVIIINAIGIIQKTILVRNIDFKTQTKISLISSTIGGVIGIVTAYKHCGVMSLVYQQITRQTINTVLLWFFSQWYPRFVFSLKSFKYQFSYGIKLLFSGLIDFVFNESASIVIGKVYTPATLGQYSRAKQFSSIFSSNFSGIMQRVTFPVLSQFQDDKAILAQQYRKIVKSLMLISSFCMLTLACTAKPIILILIGEKWTEAIIYLQIICFNDMFYPIKQVNLNAIQVCGRSDLILKVTILKRIIQIVPIVLGIYSIYYMLYGLVIASVCGLCLNAYFSSKCIPYSLKEQLFDLARPLGISIIPCFFMYLVTLMNFSLFVQLIMQLVVGISVFILLVKITKLSEYYFIKEIIVSIRKRMIYKMKNK